MSSTLVRRGYQAPHRSKCSVVNSLEDVHLSEVETLPLSGDSEGVMSRLDKGDMVQNDDMVRFLLQGSAPAPPPQ